MIENVGSPGPTHLGPKRHLWQECQSDRECGYRVKHPREVCRACHKQEEP